MHKVCSGMCSAVQQWFAILCAVVLEDATLVGESQDVVCLRQLLGCGCTEFMVLLLVDLGIAWRAVLLFTYDVTYCVCAQSCHACSSVCCAPALFVFAVKHSTHRCQVWYDVHQYKVPVWHT